MMEMVRAKRVSFAYILSALMFTSSIASAQVETEPTLSIDNLKRISAKRVGRTTNEYQFTGTLTNTGEPLSNVIATVTSTSGATTIVESVLEFGDIGTGETLTEDTFTFQQNRRYRFSPKNLEWSFTFDPAGENLAPQITSAPVTGGSSGNEYSYQVIATDPNPGDTLTYSLGTAPAGMTIDPATGLIEWTPATAMQADVDVHVTDAAGLLDRQIYLISVTNGAGDQPPSIDAIANQRLSVGQTLSLAASASDPEGQPLRYRLVSAPDGFGINSGSGVMSWRPDSAGTHTVMVRVSDVGGQSDSTIFSVTVDAAAEPNQPPALAAINAQSVDTTDTWWLLLQGTDPDENDVLRYSLSGAPAGVNINPDSGQVYWTPGIDDKGRYDLTAIVTDSVGASASRSFTLEVIGRNTPPVANNDAYTVGIRKTLDVAAPGLLANDSDANGDTLTARQTAAPVKGTLSRLNDDGSFQYQPPTAPPIEIGLQTQCEFSGNGRSGWLAADVDADGHTEMVNLQNSGKSIHITVLNGKDCALKQSTKLQSSYGQARPAADGELYPILVNLDSDPELELVFPYFRWSSFVGSGPVNGSARLMAFNLDGSPVWEENNGYSEAILVGAQNILTNASAVDLDGDGTPELIAAYSPYHNGSLWGPGNGRSSNPPRLVAFNGEDGSIEWIHTGASQWAQLNVAFNIADLDMDGTVELIYGISVISHEGEVEFTLPSAPYNQGFPQHLISAVANFDDDPYPEILSIDRYNHYVFEHTGELKWRREMYIEPTGYRSSARSLITVAELDGDRWPEYVVVQKRGGALPLAYNAFHHDGSPLWTHFDTPLASGHGYWYLPAPIAFDFDRDGIDELVAQYRPDGADAAGIRASLYVLDGQTGDAITSFNTGSWDRLNEGDTVTIADIDNDGQAEIIANYAAPYGGGTLFLLEGLEGNPLPPARTMRNQKFYMPTQVNLDATLPGKPLPYWLIPGLNKVNSAAVIPGEMEDQKDHFKYVANDGSDDSNEAQVNITLAVANAPQLVSTPVLGASPGFNYEYGALATDADFGETFTWELVDAPAGMTINSFGIINWEPGAGDLGPHNVQIVVTDSRGYSDSQAFTIDVKPAVVVPDLIGQTRAAAATALTSAGLVAGNVTENFDLLVAEGLVISQSVPGGEETGAGSPVSYVVSLGPQPIFVPLLVGTEKEAAIAALEALTLNAGNMTYENSDSVAKGSVLRQSVAATTELATGESVDLVISGGPALQFGLSKNLLGPGEISVYAAQAFSPEGNPIALPGDASVSISASTGAAGTAPAVSGNSIVTSGDTRGGWQVRISSASLGVDLSQDIVVQENFAPGGAQESYQTFISQIADIQATIGTINDALKSGDMATARAAAEQLVVWRNAIDLLDLRLTTAAAADTGFLLTQFRGIPSSSTKAYSLSLQSLRNAVRESTAYMAQLKQGRARDDNIRMGVVAANLDRSGQAFVASPGTTNNMMIDSGNLHALLSVEMPALIAQLLDTNIAALRDEGVIAAAGPMREAYRFAALDDPRSLDATQPVFFSLPSLMATTNIHMKIVKQLYVPIVKRIASNMQNLVLAGAIRAVADPAEIPGIVTGASLSFHGFELGHGIVEAETFSVDPLSNYVVMIGPTLLADVASAVNELKEALGKVSKAKGAINKLRKAADLKDPIAGVVKAVKDGVASGTPDKLLPGCVFDGNPVCQQLGFSKGFPSVHKNGSFPGPVLFIVYDATSGRISIGNFLFMPKK